MTGASAQGAPADLHGNCPSAAKDEQLTAETTAGLTPPAATADLRRCGSSPVARVPQPSLHVRLVTWDDHPALGGQGVYVDELRRHLLACGTQVSTVAGHGSNAVAYPKVTGRGHLDLSLQLARRPELLVEGHPDVLHVSGGPGGIAMLRRTDRPVVVTAHHTHRQSPGWRALRSLAGAVEGVGYRRAARVAAVSASTATAVVEMGVPADQVEVVPPGIRLRQPPRPVERDPLRMAFVGRLEPDKGPLDAVAAMAAVIDEVPGAHGVVIGTGSQRAAVTRAAATSRGRILVLGRLEDEDLAIELAQAAVVLVPSRFEGLGMAALEAMAAGAAVVGYDVDGLHDTVGRFGVLVPAGSWTALRDAVRALVRDRSAAGDLGHHAAAAVRLEWSWARCAEHFIDIYRDITGA